MTQKKMFKKIYQHIEIENLSLSLNDENFNENIEYEKQKL